MPKSKHKKSAAECRRRKTEKVMHEFKHGSLKSSSGGRVTSRSQAVAIALSSARSACGGGRRPKSKGRSRK